MDQFRRRMPRSGSSDNILLAQTGVRYGLQSPNGYGAPKIPPQLASPDRGGATSHRLTRTPLPNTAGSDSHAVQEPATNSPCPMDLELDPNNRVCGADGSSLGERWQQKVNALATFIWTLCVSLASLAVVIVRLPLHRDAPRIVSSYTQLIVNVSILFVFCYLLFVVHWSIRHDVDTKVDEYSQEILAQISECHRHYMENRCGEAEGPPPALGPTCASWEACMRRDPAVVARTRIGAETLAEIVNSFVEPLSYKTIGTFCVLLLTFVAATNLMFRWGPSASSDVDGPRLPRGRFGLPSPSLDTYGAMHQQQQQQHVPIAHPLSPATPVAYMVPCGFQAAVPSVPSPSMSISPERSPGK